MLQLPVFLNIFNHCLFHIFIIGDVLFLNQLIVPVLFENLNESNSNPSEVIQRRKFSQCSIPLFDFSSLNGFKNEDEVQIFHRKTLPKPEFSILIFIHGTNILEFQTLLKEINTEFILSVLVKPNSNRVVQVIITNNSNHCIESNLVSEFVSICSNATNCFENKHLLSLSKP
jgi:hypothetical protein